MWRTTWKQNTFNFLIKCLRVRFRQQQKRSSPASKMKLPGGDRKAGRSTRVVLGKVGLKKKGDPSYSQPGSSTACPGSMTFATLLPLSPYTSFHCDSPRATAFPENKRSSKLGATTDEESPQPTMFWTTAVLTNQTLTNRSKNFRLPGTSFCHVPEARRTRGRRPRRRRYAGGIRSRQSRRIGYARASKQKRGGRDRLTGTR